ncbi:hypothetical protein Goklo_026435, partial [Gossypium klotzschianum]|nr:hypothetical protein [Gossypium klotzschianum]
MEVMMKRKIMRFYNTWKVLINYFMLHILLCNYIMGSILKQPCMDSKQSGETWSQEILDGHESRCLINFNISKIVFTSWRQDTIYKLQDISSHEMLGIFLYIFGTGAKVSQCRERFQRSRATINRYFANVLEK